MKRRIKCGVPGRGEKMQLEGGGQLAFDEYGDANGVPVLFCHGWPSSRSMAELTDIAARETGVRIISPDRPGVGLSSFHRERQLLDWPPLVKQLLAKLGIGKFHILAISGGAPYAYATAWAMPDRVEALAIVSGAPPIAELQDRAGLLRLYRWMLALYASRPEVLRRLFHVARPFASLRMSLRYRPFLRLILQKMDAEALRDSRAFEACFESSRQAWRSSAEGVMTDAEIFAKPWGFSLEEIQTPIRLWHGRNDRTFSFRLAEELAQRFQNCRLKVVENAGHYSLPIRHTREILADLIAQMPE
jgi:pimeloyl-ACP methyl ester carboxylesterase